MGSSAKRKNFLPIIGFGLLTLSDIIVIIVVSITDTRYNATTDLVTRVLLPVLLLPFVGFVGIIIQRIKRKREEKWHQTDYDDLLENEDKMEESKKEIKLVLEPIVFQGDRENQICSLCNQTVKEGHVILVCPRCVAIFHHEHLMDWLKDNPLCPVCNEDL